MILQTIFEVILCVIILLGLKYEPIISKWEEKTFYKILEKFDNTKTKG